MDFPRLIKVVQRFAAAKLADVEAEVQCQLAACGVAIKPGARVAIAAGSRGISNLAQIIRQVVQWVRSQGAEPFIVPAMGSHGGATAEGQRGVLESYSVTEEYVGAPIRSSMSVVELPRGDLPVPLFFDEQAWHADGTIVVNRVKPHTSFHGQYESGLMKMITIGLGKHAQALAIHALGLRGLREIMPVAARRILEHGNVVLGLAIVENAYDQTLLVRAIPAVAIPEQEPLLLEIARQHMPRLPVEDLDILIVDEMGKNISGLGMDPNVIGRLRIRGEPEPPGPRVKVIMVRDLTAESHGNAIGVGLADVITRQLFNKIDFQATYENAVTSTFLDRAKIPVIAESDAQALEIAVRACRLIDPAQPRVIRIRNTLRLDELYVSPAVLAEIKDRDTIETAGPAWHDAIPTA